jgi:hypothetical protein
MEHVDGALKLLDIFLEIANRSRFIAALREHRDNDRDEDQPDHGAKPLWNRDRSLRQAARTLASLPLSVLALAPRTNEKESTI